ncbi:MAG: glycosyltransferase [Acidiferrobacteraceae bacterium]
MRKQRVVHIIDRLPPDGAERLLADVLRSRSGDFEYTVLCLVEGGPLVQEIEQSGVPVVILGRRGRYDFRLLLRLITWLKEYRPVAVHTHLFTADSWGRLAAFLAHVPGIYSTVHSTNTWKGNLHRLVDRMMARLSTKVIACSEEVEVVLRDRDRIPANRLVTIANGVDLRRFASLPEVDLADEFDFVAGATTLIVVGRLHPAKGHHDLLPALETLRTQGFDFVLLIVGEGELEGELRQEVRDRGLDANVRFCGFRQDVLALIAAADTMVMPSRWEGLPMALLEAMALGKPVVATSVGGIPNVIQQGENGFLVAPRDVEDMARKLGALIGDRTLRKRIGGQAGKTVRERFSAENVARRYEELYRSVGKERTTLGAGDEGSEERST